MSEDRIDDLLEQYWETDDAVSRIALLEEAIRVADAGGYSAQGYHLRLMLIDVATFSGHPDKSLVAFVWCLSEFDKDPDEYDVWEIYWKYKWIIAAAVEFPSISREQIARMNDDLERRLRELGWSLHAVHSLRCFGYMRMGDFERSLESHAAWKQSETDDFSDCDACEADSEVELMVRLKRGKEALKLAQPILSGRLSCEEVPQLTYGTLMRSLLREGKLDKCEQMLEKGYRQLVKNPDFLAELSEHQLYLIRQGRFVKAVNTFEKCMPWASVSPNLDARYQFYWAGALLIRSLAASGKSERKLRLPPKLPCYRQQSQYDLGELADWLEQEAGAIAEQFNRRNGNTYYSELMQESRELAGL